MAAGDVLIICEAGTGQTESANARLVATGVAYAKNTGGRLVCLLMGHSLGSVADELSRFANEVRVVESPHLANYDCLASLGIVRAQVEELRPELVLFGHTYIGMDLAPRLAARLGVAVASNCFDLTVNGGAVSFTRPMYRGRVTAKVVLESRPMIATLQYGGTELPAATATGTLTAIAFDPAGDRRIRPVKMIEPSRDGIDIAKADIVVAGGRGIGERNNYALVDQLAAALGGVAACSRPLVDMAWFDVDRQVGLSGNTVKPKLYVACGISGAIEHMHGMKESGIIVAINTDPDAPIFRVAHFGVVADLNEIMPALTSAVAAVKAGRPNTN